MQYRISFYLFRIPFSTVSVRRHTLDNAMDVSACPRNIQNPGKMGPKKAEDPPLVLVSICNRAEVRV